MDQSIRKRKVPLQELDRAAYLERNTATQDQPTNHMPRAKGDEDGYATERSTRENFDPLESAR